MKKFFLKSLPEHIGNEIVDTFYLEKVTNNFNRKGNRWVALLLGDITGSISAKMWDESVPEDLTKYEGKVVTITGTVGIYNGTVDLTVTKVDEATDYAMEDYVPCLSKEQVEVLSSELLAAIDEVVDEGLSKLLRIIFTPSRIKLFASLPAGITLHHNFNGGLLIHTLEVLRLAKASALVYNDFGRAKDHFTSEVNMDLVIAGALLHDIGKISEYEPFPVMDRKKRGVFIGHLCEGVNIVTAFNAKLGSEGLSDTSEISHIILASHYDKGVAMPLTREAMIVSQADMTSSLLDSYDCCVKAYDKSHPESKDEYIFNPFTGNKVWRCNVCENLT